MSPTVLDFLQPLPEGTQKSARVISIVPGSCTELGCGEAGKLPFTGPNKCLEWNHSMSPLSGIRIVHPPVSLPGLLAAGRLAGGGAPAQKIGPRGGDPLDHFCPSWY